MRMMKNKLLIIGGGGHSKVVIDCIKDSPYIPIGIIENNRELIGKKVCNIPIIGIDDDLDYYFSVGISHAIIALGHVGNYALRNTILDKIEKIGYSLATICHKSSIISSEANIGEGTLVCAGAIINPDTKIGKNCILNTGAILEHDSVLGDNVHLAPKSVVAGGVSIGENSFIGMGSNIIQGITIGKNCIIGAGSVVIHNIPDNTKVVGVPASKY